MRPLVIVGVIACLALVSVSAGQDKDRAKNEGGKDKEEMKKLEGTWTLVSFEQSGEKTAAKKFPPLEIFGFNEVTTIKDGKMDMTFEGKTLRYSITVDPMSKPKSLDRVVTSEGKWKGATHRYLYELDGDTLRLCYNVEMSDVRPKEFKSEGPITILTFEKKKR